MEASRPSHCTSRTFGAWASSHDATHASSSATSVGIHPSPPGSSAPSGGRRAQGELAFDPRPGEAAPVELDPSGIAEVELDPAAVTELQEAPLPGQRGGEGSGTVAHVSGFLEPLGARPVRPCARGAARAAASGSQVSPRTTRAVTAPYSPTDTPPAHGTQRRAELRGRARRLSRRAAGPHGRRYSGATERPSRWRRRRAAPRASTATGRGSGRRQVWELARSRGAGTDSAVNFT